MSAANVLKFIKEKEADFVDLRFTDPRGKLQHLTMDVTIVDDDMLNDGVFFDGSSIAGWKAINESDMILKPDTSRFFLDPFTSHNTVVLFCDILDAIKKTPYERDPRGVAKKAEEYLKEICQNADVIVTGVGDRDKFTLTSDMIKKDAVVIDVATTHHNGKLKGDSDFDEIISKASYASPVPGGVGPMTVAMLLKNTTIAAALSKGIDIKS